MSRLYYSILFQVESTAGWHIHETKIIIEILMMQKFSKKMQKFLDKSKGTRLKSYNKLLGPNSAYMPSKVSELTHN